jgi:hypothetical protein
MQNLDLKIQTNKSHGCKGGLFGGGDQKQGTVGKEDEEEMNKI